MIIFLCNSLCETLPKHVTWKLCRLIPMVCSTKCKNVMGNDVIMTPLLKNGKVVTPTFYPKTTHRPWKNACFSPMPLCLWKVTVFLPCPPLLLILLENHPHYSADIKSNHNCIPKKNRPSYDDKLAGTEFF